MIFWGLVILGCAIGYGLVQIANAIDKASNEIASRGIILYHQPRGFIQFEYEKSNDGRNWKVTTKPQY